MVPTAHLHGGWYRTLRLGLAGCILLVLGSPLWGQEAKPETPPPSRTDEIYEPGSVEVHFVDGSTLRLLLRDKNIAVASPYGKLEIPIKEVQSIEFATRTPEDIARKVDAAIAHLGDHDFAVREKAMGELLKARERAYPALVRASQSKDLEVVHRAEELIDKIRAAIPEGNLETRDQDVVQTTHSKIAGRIEGAALQVETEQFGRLQLKLADARSLRSLNAVEESDANLANVEPDPGNLMQRLNDIGKVYRFRVTGAFPGAAGRRALMLPAGGFAPGGVIIGENLWGTDTYTADSTVALAAVHAGVLKPGQTGIVRVKIVPTLPAFEGSTRHGVTSAPFGPFPGAYKFVR
jgi:hypothetical protein